MASEGGGTSGQGASASPGPTGAANDPEQKEVKRIFRFSFSVNKKVADETEMTQDFINDLKHYVEFDDTVQKCATYLENIFIPFAAKGSKEDEAFLRLGSALGEFKSFVPQPYVEKFEKFAFQMKQASVQRKKHQEYQSFLLRPMKKFHTENFEMFLQQKKKFDEARKKMDQAKAEVRDAKTTTAIEKKAICYQLAVDDFDVQTEELIKIIEALPKVKQAYVRDIFSILSNHKQYHIDMSKFFAAADVQNAK